MKKINILVLFLLGLGFSPLFVSADIIPSNMHKIDRCSYITNLSDFPDFYMIQKGFSMGGGGGNIYMVNTATCFTSRSSGTFYVVDKKYFDSKGKEYFEKDGLSEKYFTKLETNFDTSWEKDGSFLKKQTINYLLAKGLKGDFVLQKDKIISEYSNGVPNKIETFPTTQNNIKKVVTSEVPPSPKVSTNESPIVNNNALPPQPKKSFWHKLACLLGITKDC